ncbi:glycosyl-transferase for dystroglycan-domain-containing protein [Cladochytrium replicatum]|nr:glycosyl-transferase for dystroglycan-domain-containing protein [Cladochytrium replicatum]
MPGYFTKDAAQSSPNDICLFTQSSINRIDLILDLASSWQGTISAALYIDKPEVLVDGKFQQVQDVLDSLSRDPQFNRSSVTISLLFGVAFTANADEVQHPYDHFYPINTLRNLALSQCRTEFVFSLDADFLPSADMYSMLTDPAYFRRLREMSDQKNSVFVVAAWEFVRSDIEYSVPVSREDLSGYCLKMEAIPFHSRIVISREKSHPERVEAWCQGNLLDYHLKITGKTQRGPQQQLTNLDCEEIQFLTNYTRWLAATDFYPVVKGSNHINRHYEPYWVARRSTLPPFDERFRGYSFNKRQHTMELQYMRFQFVVIPRAFVIHRWHRMSDSKQRLSGMVKATVGRAFQRFQHERKTLDRQRSTQAAMYLMDFFT